MSDYNKTIVRRQSAPVAPRTLVPEDVSYSVSSDAVIATRQLWDALRRQWRLAFGIFFIVVLAVTAGTLLRPVNYRATGLLEIRPENAEAVPVSTLFGPQRLAGDSLATQIGILQSVTLAERVVSEGHLDGRAESWMAVLNPLRWLRGAPVDDLQKKVQVFQEHLSIVPQEGSRLVRVSFDAEDPKLAADVVNSVLKNYLRLRVEETARSEEWLSTQRDEARAKLDASQQELQAYVRQHGLQVLETGQGETENLVNDRLKQLHGQLIEAQAQRYAQQSAYELVSRQAGRGPGGVSNRVTEDLSVRLADLQREAAGLSATFHDDYPRLQEVRKQIRALETALTEETQLQATRAQREYQAAVRNESLIASALERQQQTAQSLQGSSAGYASLKREVATDQQLYEALDQKLKEVSISGALKATNAGVVDPAKPPREPYQSPLTLNLALGVVLGLIGGVGGALMRNSGDNRVHRIEDVDGFLGVRAVAVIPYIPVGRVTRNLAWPANRRSESIIWSGATPKQGHRRWFQIGRGHEHRSVLADAFAALRSAVIFNQDSSKARSVLVTSPGTGDGKTTVCVNLALSLARLGNRVLLIDADLRHPSVHEALGMIAESGLAKYLAGQGEWWSGVQSDVFPNLAVMPAGNDDAEPADLLAGPRMRQLLDEATKAYDYVVIDSPPLLPHLADSRILAELADGVLLTVRGGATPRDVALRAVSQLNRVLGIVVNGFDMRETPPYYRETWPAGAGGVV
jgi:capsular exopolysaccharide synthesis family protein